MDDDTDRPTLPAPPELDPHERPTLATCLACEGHHQTERRVADGDKPSGTFSFVVCRWCTLGLMTPEQAQRWAERRHKSETPAE